MFHKRESCLLRRKGNCWLLWATLEDGAREIKVDTPALLTVNSFRTCWQEEAVGEVFARQVFSVKWFLKSSGSWRSCDRLFPGVQSEDFGAKISCHPTSTPHCHLVIFPVLGAFFFLAALGLCCCTWAFSSCGERGLLFVVVRGLLIAVASLVAEHGLRCTASVVVVHGLSSCGSWALERRLSSCGARA